MAWPSPFLLPSKRPGSAVLYSIFGKRHRRNAIASSLPYLLNEPQLHHSITPTMGKSSKRNIDEVDTYASDGGFVSSDDGKAPKSKKTKKEKSMTQTNQSWPVSPQLK